MKLEPKMPHFPGAKNCKEHRRLAAEYCAANGVKRPRKLPLSARRRAMAWKRFDHDVPLRKAEARYLELDYLEEHAGEFGAY